MPQSHSKTTTKEFSDVHSRKESEINRRLVTDGGRGAPFAHQKPARRRNRAESHFCDAVGSTVFCPRPRCPYCSPDGDEQDGDGEQGGKP